MDQLKELLQQFPSNMEVLYEKGKNTTGREGVAVFGINKSLTFAVSGFANLNPDDSFPSTPFRLDIGEMRNLLSVADKIDLVGEKLIGLGDGVEMNWRFLPSGTYSQKKGVKGEFKNMIVLPATFVTKLKLLSSKMSVDNYLFTLKNGELNVKMEGGYGDTTNTATAHIPATFEEEVEVKFSTELKEAWGEEDVEMSLQPPPQPSRFKRSGNGWVVNFYLIPEV